MGDYVLVTDYEKVSPDSFYLSDEWVVLGVNSDKTPEQLKEMAENGVLFEAFLVSAITYLIYRQMDADLVYIDGLDNVVVHCETTVIGNRHKHCKPYDV